MVAEQRDGAFTSVEDHVLGRRREFLVSLDHLVHAIQEVLLADALPPRPDGEHSRLGAYGVKLGASRVGTEAGEELVTNVPVAVHPLAVDP